MNTVIVLGRQPALGLAELESLYGPEHVRSFGERICLLDLDHKKIDFDRLGGSVRLAKILNTLPSKDWSEIEKYLITTCPKHAEYINGKLSFGISVFGLKVDKRKIAQTALKIKKVIKQSGKSVRMVPHDNTELGSATVLYNKLTSDNGWELLIISDGKTSYLAQTVRIQDIDAYSARDQARPYRDAKVGMLPPKLAQIILNLAVGEIEDNRSESLDLRGSASDSKIQDPRSKICILDPFCGTGVVLQEATLMNYDVYGSDIDPRMVQYSIDNLAWLDKLYPEAGDYRRIEIGDATKMDWRLEIGDWRIVVAGETYLGKPLSSLPANEVLSKIIYDVNLLHHKFLENIGKQIPSGTKLCLAIPTWRGKREFLHLPTLDYLSDLGYTRMSFEHVSNTDLIYHRENQIVGRELLVLIKN
jgi:tRNA G10  N-methylase Trm11